MRMTSPQKNVRLYMTMQSVHCLPVEAMSKKRGVKSTATTCIIIFSSAVKKRRATDACRQTRLPSNDKMYCAIGNAEKLTCHPRSLILPPCLRRDGGIEISRTDVEVPSGGCRNGSCGTGFWA